MSTGPGGPAPRVTITNPNAPVSTADVLGDDSVPWRPRPWLLKALALAVALTAAAVVPPKVVQARAQDRRDATAAADAVLLSFLPGRTSDRLDVVVSNDGPTPVRLVDVRVVGSGYRPVQAGQQVAAHRDVSLTLADTRTCGEALLEAGPSRSALVRARTRAGLLVSRTLRLTDDAWAALVEAAQRRCGYLTPEHALTTRVQVGGRGTRLSLRLTLHNSGRVPLLVSSADVLGSPLISEPATALPLEVPAGATRELSATTSLDCDPTESYGGGGPLSRDLELQVLPVLRDGRGALTSVSVDAPVVQQRLALLPTCKVEAVSQTDTVTVG